MNYYKYLITSVLSIFISLSLCGQDSPSDIKNNHNFDLAIAVGGRQFTVSPSWAHLHGIGQKGKFKIGYGVRFNSVFGSNQNFVTAPAKLTSGKTGLGVLFSENIPANFDTLTLVKSQVNSLNAFINLQYSFTSKFELGFNIDVIGYSFGGQQGGTFSSNGVNSAATAKPTGFNLLLTSDNDLGSLNSELYARYWLSEKWAIKGGFTFIFSEYTTTRELQTFPEANDRFRYKNLQGMLSVTFAPFKK